MLQFTDETLRQGPQSLWATRMSTQTMLEACTLLDDVGVQKVRLLSGASFETAVKFMKDDPWERLRLVSRQLRKTQADVLIRSRNLFGWSRYSDDVVELFLRCLQRNGATSVKIFDALNDVSCIRAHCRIAKRLGLKVSGSLGFSASPIHTDEHFAVKVREFVELGVDTFIFGDASGIMTGERTTKLLAALKEVTGGRVPLGFYAHTSMGLAYESYRAAIEAGVSSVTTAAEPLANGISVPSTRQVADIAQQLGVETRIDGAALEKLDDFMYWAAFRDDKPVGQPVEFDQIAYDRFIEHQIPGGMMSNFRNQLREAGMLHRLDEVLEEAGRVRAELGYPVMVTPFSQFVGVQAVFNVLQGDRYKTCPDELRLYAKGFYGDSGAPIDANVLDRIFDGKSIDRTPPDELYGERMVDAFRRDKGPFHSDEQLLLHLFYGRPVVEALEKEKSTFFQGVTVRSPLQVLLGELMKQSRFRSIAIHKPGTATSKKFRCEVHYA